MADEIRVNRQQPQMHSQGGMADMQNGMMMPASKKSKTPWIILIVVIVVLGVLGVLFRDKFMGSKNMVGDKTKETNSGYQAVFLTNGQVYFGKLSSASSDYATLKDIYYLQVTNPPALQGSNSQQQQAKLELVKLGKELHGPVDEMKINRSQILFFEDMKEEGQVMQAIRTNQKNTQSGSQNNQQQAPATNNTAPANNNTNTNTNTNLNQQNNSGN